MKNKMIFVFVILAISFITATALAAGPYVGGEAGAVFLSDSSFSSSLGANGDLKSKTGFGLGVLGGFDFGTYRLEGEFAYRKNNNKEFAFAGSSTDPLGGDVSSMALMMNGYYDFRMLSPMFVPYIGGGLGGARVKAKATDSDGVTIVDDTQTVFAYQLATGVGFVLTKQFTLDLGYKYFATAKPEFEVKPAYGGGTVKGEYASHNIFLGARFNF